MSQFNLFFTLLIVALVALCAKAADPVCDGSLDYLPDQDDCNAYFRCINSIAVPFRCPTNLHWDAKQTACNYPELAGC